MKTMWYIMRFIWGVATVVCCAAILACMIFVIDPTMEKINKKLGKEIKHARNY